MNSEPTYPHLTKAETEILQLYSDGYDCREIARIRQRSIHTVRNQCASIKKKLNSPNMCRAVGIGLHLKLIVLRHLDEPV